MGKLTKAMQSIETYRIPATTNRGARLCGVQIHSWSNEKACKVTVSENDPEVFKDVDGKQLSDDQCHARVALLVMEKMDWHGEMVGGHSRKGMIWVFTCTDHYIDRKEDGAMSLMVYKRNSETPDWRKI